MTRSRSPLTSSPCGALGGNGESSREMPSRTSRGEHVGTQGYVDRQPVRDLARPARSAAPESAKSADDALAAPYHDCGAGLAVGPGEERSKPHRRHHTPQTG